MKEQRLLRNTYLYLHFCIWVLCYPTAVWCVYQAVLHHAVLATCLSTANWEVARVLCNGCCVYTRMYIQCIGACSVYIIVWSLGLCTYGGHTYSTVHCAVLHTYSICIYVHYAIVHVHCVIVGVRYATAHMHCVIVARYFFESSIDTLYVGMYVYTYIPMASCCT